MAYSQTQIEQHLQTKLKGKAAKRLTNSYEKLQRNRKQRRRLKNVDNEPEYKKYTGWEF